MQLLNVKEKEVFGYQLLRVRGYSKYGSEFSVETSSSIAVIDFHFKGYFKALILLTKGLNTITFKDDKGECIEFHCSYDPTLINVSTKDSTKHRVRLVYFIPKDNNGDFLASEGNCDIEAAKLRLPIAALMMQLFCAQNLQELGYPSKTFGFQVDSNGYPEVTVVTSQKNAQEWMELHEKSDGGVTVWQTIHQELSSQLEYRHAVLDLCMFSASGYNKDSKTPFMTVTLGGPHLALFPSHFLHCWPSGIKDIFSCFKNETKIDTNMFYDNSNSRGTSWTNYSSSLGGFLHQLGHALMLPHTATGIMGKGYHHVNRFFCISEPKYNTNFFTLSDEKDCLWEKSSMQYLLSSPLFKLAKHPLRITKQYQFASGSYMEQSEKVSRSWIEKQGEVIVSQFEEIHRNNLTNVVHIFNSTSSMFLKLDPCYASFAVGPKDSKLVKLNWSVLDRGNWSPEYSGNI